MSSCTPDIKARIESYNSFNSWRSSTTDALNSSSPDLPKLTEQILSTTNCLEESINTVSTLSTADAQTDLEVKHLEMQIEEEKKNIEISQQRLDLLRNPVNDYEGWFHLGKPLRPISGPILLGLSTFLIMITLGYVLQLRGITIQMNGVSTGWLTPYIPYMKWGFWSILMLFLGAGAYYYIRQ